MIYSNFALTGCMILAVLNLSFITSPAPGTGRGDERLIDQVCTTAPTATIDNTLLSQKLTVTTVEVFK